MSDNQEILPGCKVRLHFSLSLPDGTEAISSFDEEPLEIIIGDGTMAEELELALYGLTEGADQTLSVDGNKAFGSRSEDNIHSVALADFPENIRPEPGLIIAFNTPDGEEIPGAMLEVGVDSAKVDFNHPLAGREVVFRALILSVDTPSAEPSE